MNKGMAMVAIDELKKAREEAIKFAQETDNAKPSQEPVFSPERALDGTSQRLRNSTVPKLTNTSSTSYAKKIWMMFM